jgi:hypothetical protein
VTGGVRRVDRGLGAAEILGPRLDARQRTGRGLNAPPMPVAHLFASPPGG